MVRCSITRCLSMVAMLGLAVPAWSAEANKPELDPTAVMKIMKEMATPGPEHEKLQPLVGNWTYTMKFWMDPSQPPMESEGTVERKWILGDRFLEEKYTGSFGGESFEGCGILGYDNAQKKFTSGWICNMCTSLSTSSGEADASGKTFTFHQEQYCPLRQKMVKGRNVLRIESDDKVVMEAYEMDDGQERKVMELISVRQK